MKFRVSRPRIVDSKFFMFDVFLAEDIWLCSNDMIELLWASMVRGWEGSLSLPIVASQLGRNILELHNCTQHTQFNISGKPTVAFGHHSINRYTNRNIFRSIWFTWNCSFTSVSISIYNSWWHRRTWSSSRTLKMLLEVR